MLIEIDKFKNAKAISEIALIVNNSYTSPSQIYREAYGDEQHQVLHQKTRQACKGSKKQKG